MNIRRLWMNVLLGLAAVCAVADGRTIPAGSTDRYVPFVAVDATDRVTRETGLTGFSVYYSLNNGALTAMTTPTVVEVDSGNAPGLYHLLIDEAGMTTLAAGETCGILSLHITQAAMEPVTMDVDVQDYGAAVWLADPMVLSSTGTMGDALAALAGIATRDATSIVDEDADLALYKDIYGVGDIATISADLSDVTYCAATDTLFTIENGTPRIQEFTRDMQHVRTITMTGFIDTEGIEWMYGTKFAVCQERSPYCIYIFDIDRDTTSVNASGATQITPTMTVTSNKGMEGLAYDPINDWFYVVVEKQANGSNGGRVFKVEMDGTTTEYTALGSALSGAGYTDLGGIDWNRESRTLLLLSEEQSTVIRATLSGTIQDELTITGMTQPEGISTSPGGRWLFVFGEPDEYKMFCYPSAPETFLDTTYGNPVIEGLVDDLETRLTSTRAGYLDKLNVTGTLAHSDAADAYKATGFSTPPPGDVDLSDFIQDFVVASGSTPRSVVITVSAGDDAIPSNFWKDHMAVFYDATLSSDRGAQWRKIIGNTASSSGTVTLRLDKALDFTPADTTDYVYIVGLDQVAEGYVR